MNWEETILFIREDPFYSQLVEKTYLEEDLLLNVERFRASEEYKETLRLIRHYIPVGKSILDVGAGNGISSISFALDGFDVVAVEPDPSHTVGAGAISFLKSHFNLSNLSIEKAYAEELLLDARNFDIVYVRQSLHHANDLNLYVKNLARYLKAGGIFFSVRDHVIFSESDKEWFLTSHALQKFYGGENAFHPYEYRKAFLNAELNVVLELKYFDSIINLFPSSLECFLELKEARIQNLRKWIGTYADYSIFKLLYHFYCDMRYGKIMNEKNIPGRMYTYISKKGK